ncbi:MAG: hypothetical protein IIU11_08300 [Bacteroidales bacterium]|jgi:hypothetical protein|nr:hypothetical protein [Bacteroidales bacterium]MBR6277912.1 hypothetical protein [Bacteroidales bacterium]MCR4558898.1 hypothetical protein [Bacteroidales bacterium]
MIKLLKYSAVVLLIILASFSEGFSQITLTSVKPGQELELKPTDDTLWVMNDARMRSVIETGRLYRLSKETNNLLTQKCDTLQEVVSKQDSLISILKTDRDYYVTELKNSREDVITAGKMAKKYRRRARLASMGIGLGVAVGVAIGYFLFKD